MAQALHEKLYTYGLYSSYLLYGLVSLGLWSSGSYVITTLDFALTMYISIFLIYSFNPYNRNQVSEFGRGIAFSAGILLLLTKVLTRLTKYINIDKNKEEVHADLDFAYDILSHVAK